MIPARFRVELLFASPNTKAMFQAFIDWLNHPLVHIGEWDITAFVLIRLVLYPALAVLAAKWVRRLTRRGLRKRGQLDEATQKSVAAIVYYVVLGIGLIVALNAAGMPLQSLAVFSGAFGLGVGLGLQQFAQNFLSGLIILLARPVRPGDWISYDGQEGSVEDVGAYSTIVRTPEDGELVVPNSQILNGKVVNWTRKRTLRMTSIQVPLAHGVEIELVREVLIQALSGCEGVLSEPKPAASVKNVRPGGVDWSLSAWTSEYVSRPGALASKMYDAALAACAKEGIAFGAA